MTEMRRSMLFIPGNSPGMIQNADVFDSDCIIIDLEDSVALDEKDSARMLLKELMQSLSFEETEMIVRINPLDTIYYEADVEALANLKIDAVLLPKADVKSVLDLSNRLMKMNSPIKIFVLIETALGVEQVYDILNASDRCLGLMLGGEDLCVDLGCERTKEGMEIFYARSRVLNAARALKKVAIDTPFTDTNDVTGLKKDTRFAKRLGFDGKAAINPRQILEINTIFSPTEAEINYAKRVIDAEQRALEEGKGVFSLDGKMVDLPIIKRAKKVISTASKIGLVKVGESE